MRHEGDAGGMFGVRILDIPGPLVLTPRRRHDDRGWLAKLFHTEALADLGLPDGLGELFVTSSGPRVIRGVHFQGPPVPQHKYVTCLAGTVLDVVLDIRSGAPSYGDHCVVELSADSGDVVYVPAGFAHGFAVLSDPAIMLYCVTHVWEPSCEGGVRWDTAGVEWPFSDPVISGRDAQLPPLAGFVSPFEYGKDYTS